MLCLKLENLSPPSCTYIPPTLYNLACSEFSVNDFYLLLFIYLLLISVVYTQKKIRFLIPIQKRGLSSLSHTRSTGFFLRCLFKQNKIHYYTYLLNKKETKLLATFSILTFFLWKVLIDFSKPLAYILKAFYSILLLS